MLVCRALSNILLLPWPNLPENEQQWPVRSVNHASLISALSRDYRSLKPDAVAPQRKMPLDDSKCSQGRDGTEIGQALSSFVADEVFTCPWSRAAGGGFCARVSCACFLYVGGPFAEGKCRK